MEWVRQRTGGWQNCGDFLPFNASILIYINSSSFTPSNAVLSTNNIGSLLALLDTNPTRKPTVLTQMQERYLWLVWSLCYKAFLPCSPSRV